MGGGRGKGKGNSLHGTSKQNQALSNLRCLMATIIDLSFCSTMIMVMPRPQRNPVPCYIQQANVCNHLADMQVMYDRKII